MKRSLTIFLVALPFFVALAFLLGGKPPAHDLPLPNPNGYDQLVIAGSMLNGDAHAYETMSEADLAGLVATNANALALGRSALTNECRVPVQYSIADLASSLTNEEAIKNLAQTMAAEGRLAESQNRPAEAALAYLDLVHLGMEAGRGGVMIDAVLGMAIEAVGRQGLENSANRLDATFCRTIASKLESLDSHRESWEDVLEQEDRLVSRLSPGLTGKLATWLFTHIGSTEIRSKLKKHFREQQEKTRALAVQFAARAYELDNGRPPANIKYLVPGYLKTVPQDPATGQDLAYPPR